MDTTQLILTGAQDPFDMYRDGFRPENCTIPIVQTPFIIYDRKLPPGHPMVVRKRTIPSPKTNPEVPEWEDLVRTIYNTLAGMDAMYPFDMRHFRPMEVSEKSFINPLPGEIEKVKDLFARTKSLLDATYGIFNEEREWYIRNLMCDAIRNPECFFHPQEAIYHLILLYEYILEAM